MKPIRPILIACTALIGGVVAPVATAAQAPEPAANASTLRLALSTRDQPVVLKCHPTGGKHPHAAGACAQLDGVGGDFRAMRADHHDACTLEYDPITATASGYWRGSPVRFEKTFANGCVLDARTGVVFDF